MTTTPVADLLDLSTAPEDPLERLIWMSGVREKVEAELEAACAHAAFEVRLRDGLEALLATGLFSRTRILRWCRAENRRRGNTVRWGDGLDPKSSAFRGH